MKLFGVVFLSFIVCHCSGDKTTEEHGEIVATSPKDGNPSFVISASIFATFSDRPKKANISMQTNSGSCDESMGIWLSANDFANCQSGVINYVDGTDDRKIQIVPFPALSPKTTYKTKFRSVIEFENSDSLVEKVISFTTQ